MENYREELSSNLETLFRTENRIAEIVKKSGLRFSTNKMTGDLGEFYAFQLLSKQKNMLSLLQNSPKSKIS